jgi:hypothetical protein
MSTSPDFGFDDFQEGPLGSQITASPDLSSTLPPADLLSSGSKGAGTQVDHGTGWKYQVTWVLTMPLYS